MADNVDVTPGTGATIATDDVSGVQYQRVKVDLGGDGAASPLVRGQQSAANSLPVTLPSDQGALAVTGTFWQATQPVSVASLPLPSGAATEATLSTAASEIGATNESAAAGDTSTSGLNGLFKRLLQRITALLAVFPTTIDTNSGNKSASTLRVVLATDQPQLAAKLLVTPDANSAVNVAQINGVTPLMGNGASGTGAQRVTLANDSTGILAGVTGAAAVAHDGVGTSINPLLVGGYASAAAPTDVSADGDAVRAWRLRNGAAAVVLTAAGALIGATGNALDINQKSFTAPTAAALTGASISASSSGDNTLVSGTASQTVRVHRLLLVAAADCTITFKDGASTSLTGAITLKAGGAIVLDLSADPWFVTSSGNGFVANLSGAVQISGRIYYTKS